ncbi:MAG: hypothetical protein ACOYJK_02875 [Prevotella sp.]|jgi:hypothetical protein
MTLLRRTFFTNIIQATGASIALVSFVLNVKATEYRMSMAKTKELIDSVAGMWDKLNFAAQRLHDVHSVPRPSMLWRL